MLEHEWMAPNEYTSKAPMKPTADRLAAWRSFLEAHQALTSVLEAELLAERGLPLTWYDVLLVLSEAPDERLRMQELARRILLSKSGLTRLFDRMERAGLVERAPSPDDRRGTLALLTAEGRRTLRRAAPVHLHGIEQHFDQYLSDAETATLRSLCERLLCNLRAQSPASDNLAAAAADE